jgi:hypothetical protein
VNYDPAVTGQDCERLGTQISTEEMEVQDIVATVPHESPEIRQIEGRKLAGGEGLDVDSLVLKSLCVNTRAVHAGHLRKVT